MRRQRIPVAAERRQRQRHQFRGVADGAEQRRTIGVQQTRGRHQIGEQADQVDSAAAHRVGGGGEPDRRQQCGVEVALLGGQRRGGGQQVVQAVPEVGSGRGEDVGDVGDTARAPLHGRQSRIDLGEDRVGVGQRSAQFGAQAGQRLGRGRQGEVQLHRVDLLGESRHRLEQRLELRRHAASGDHRTAGDALRGRIARRGEIQVLVAEDGRGLHIGAHVGRYHPHEPRLDLRGEPGRRGPVAPHHVDIADPADRHPVERDLRPAVEHQPGAPRFHDEFGRRRQVAAEQQKHQRGDDAEDRQ